jgi:hypothetical protein
LLIKRLHCEYCDAEMFRMYIRIKYLFLNRVDKQGYKHRLQHRFEPVGWFCRDCKSFVTDNTRTIENSFLLEDKFPDLRVVFDGGRHNCYHCGHDDDVPVYYRPDNVTFKTLARYCGLCKLFALQEAIHLGEDRKFSIVRRQIEGQSSELLKLLDGLPANN